MERPLDKIKYLMVHHSATPAFWTVHDLRALHKGMGYNDVGYHFVHQLDGMRVGRYIGSRGAHCVAEKYPWDQQDMNWSAVGYCLIGDYSHEPPDPKTINDAAYYIRRICEKYKIPVDRKHILPHYIASLTICPGPRTMELLYRKLKI